MADYPSILTKGFEIPLHQNPAVSGIDPFALQQMQQMAQPGPRISAPEEGLYEVEGLTKEYYDKWAAVNEFAQNMHSMGIDITKPDALNPQSQAAHRWYLKAMADLQRHGNQLKNSQKALEQYTAAKLTAHGQDIGLTSGFNPNEDLLTPFDITNTGETAMTRRVNTDLAKEVNDPALAGQLNNQISEKAGVLKQQLADMIMSGANEAQIAEKVNEINSLQRANYNDTTRWQERQQNARAAAGKEEEAPDYTRVDLVQRVKGGETNLLKSSPKVRDVRTINTPRQQGIYVDIQGIDKPKFISFKDNPNIEYEINELFNQGQEGKAVSIDQYEKLRKTYPGQINTPEAKDNADTENRFLGALTVQGDYKTRKAAQQYLAEKKAKLQIPSEVSGGDFDYYVKDIMFAGSGVVIKLADDKGNAIGGDHGVVTLDLEKPGDKDKFQQILDRNAQHLDLTPWQPEPRKVPTLDKQGVYGNSGTDVADTSYILDLKF